MARVRLIGGLIVVAATVALAAVAWAGEPRADAGTLVDVAPLSVATPATVPSGAVPEDTTATPAPRPSGRPTPVAPPPAPPVPLSDEGLTRTPPSDN